MTSPYVTAFFDAATYTVSYVVADPDTRRAAIIDPVLDYDASSGRTSTVSADKILAFVAEKGFGIGWILETHVHADHLSAASYIKEKTGGEIGIGEQVSAVQGVFKDVFNMRDLEPDGGQFNRLFKNDAMFTVGDLEGYVMHTPGHTPACVTYVIGDAAFVGDTLFMPDFGTARTDFPGGDAGELYDSIQKILALPPETRLFTCHDYKAPGRDEFAWETTVAEQRESNVHVRQGVTRKEFIAMREGRDGKLGMPALILPSIQVNVRAGMLPAPEDNDIRYLKIPIDAL